MTRRRRQADQSPISEAHFRLLREFGRNELPKKISKKEAVQLWEMMCQTANLPKVPREQVEEAWKQYVGGQSDHSGIAINGDIDPHYTTIGVTYGGRLTAAHTTKTPALLKRVLLIWSRAFRTRVDFLNAAERLCKDIVEKTFQEEEEEA